MVTVRAPSHGNGNSRLLPLACGFVLGIVTMWVISFKNTSKSFLTELPHASSSSSSAEDGGGWHPIHVFYGEESGLDIKKDQKWFAQVHQDEVIMDLIGGETKKGYFIDLASNDAKELSNTLALERAGWDGLCIEPNPVYWYGLRYVCVPSIKCHAPFSLYIYIRTTTLLPSQQ